MAIPKRSYWLREAVTENGTSYHISFWDGQGKIQELCVPYDLRYTEIKELTPAIVTEFIDYIMVSKKQVIDGKTVYPIDIYYNGVGIITAPSAEEYEEMFQERLKQKRAKEQKTA